MNIHFFLAHSIVIIVFCAPPPKPKPAYEIFVEEPVLIRNSNSSLKNLEENSEQIVEESNAIIYLLKNGKNETHEIKITAKNLDADSSFTKYSFNISLPAGEKLDLKSNECYKSKLLESEITEKDKCIPSFKVNENKYIFTYNYVLKHNEQIIINYSYLITKNTTEKIYRQESISIPNYPNAWCNYKFIISDKFLSLGLDNGYFTKEDNNSYIYNYTCPKYNSLKEVIRFTTSESYWISDTEVYIDSNTKISEDVKFTIPLYYKGGKNRNKNYKITSLADGSILGMTPKDETFIGVKVPGKKEKTIGFNLHTAFINKMDGEFIVNTSENYYKLNDNIYDKVKSKAQSIIKDESGENKDLPDYYKIGKFVHSYMHYDLDYSGEQMSVKEIFEGKKGVCEHYTILYNAMLNAIGIKTIKVFGWAFTDDQDIFVDITDGHAWTAALINGTWKELDATWGLFEGIPATHILQGIGDHEFNVEYKSKAKFIQFKRPKLTRHYPKPSLKLVDNLDEEDTFESPEVNLSKYYKILLLKYALFLIFLML